MLNKKKKHFYPASNHSLKLRSLQTGFSGNVIILSVLYYGGIMVSQSNISVGNLSAFLLYAAYIGVSMSGLSSFYSEMNRGLGASSRLWELIDRVPQIPISGGIIPVEEAKGEIIFKDVLFSYPSRTQHLILDGLNLCLPSGSVTAIVGASGSGKSTLAALLLRLYDPQGGDVILDRKSVKEYDPVWLRKCIGTVSQVNEGVCTSMHQFGFQIITILIRTFRNQFFFPAQ